MQEFIQNNPTVFIGVFAVVVVGIIIIRIAAAIIGGKKKKAALKNEEVAMILFDEDAFFAGNNLSSTGLSGYKIYAVNGAKPRIVGGDLLVPAGKTVVDLQYLISGDSFGSRHTNVFERQQVALDVERGKKYTMKYNILASVFEWKAN
jgi:hypothetical protein